jgi:hypothetical protein
MSLTMLAILRAIRQAARQAPIRRSRRRNGIVENLEHRLEKHP